MGIFGKPNIEKAKQKRDVDALIKALGHKDPDVIIYRHAIVIPRGTIADSGMRAGRRGATLQSCGHKQPPSGAGLRE